MDEKTTSVKSLLEKFNIDDVELSPFFLMQEYKANFTKCKKVKDAINYDASFEKEGEHYDFYYEIKSDDNIRTIIITSDENNNGKFASFFQPSPKGPKVGEVWGYHGGLLLV